MMGHTHALSGAAAWLAAVPLLSREQLLGSYAVSLSPAQQMAGAVVCAGAAVLPDIDHHNGLIANAFGPVTRRMCTWIGKVSGGHRQATHSILFALAAGYAMGLLATHAEYAWWAALFLIVGLGVRGVGPDFGKHQHWSILINCVVAAVAVYLMRGLDMSFAGYAVALGCLAHLAGDCLTPRGCPLFWPAPWRVGIPLIPRTGDAVEQRVVVPLVAVVAVVLAVLTMLGDGTAHW